MMFNLLGFEKGPEDIHLDSPGGVYFSQRLFPSVLDKLARTLGVQLDSVQLSKVDPALSTEDFEIATGSVAAGKIAGPSFDYVGTVNGEPFLTQRWVHHLGALPDGCRTAPEPEVYPRSTEFAKNDGRPGSADR